MLEAQRGISHETQTWAGGGTQTNSRCTGWVAGPRVKSAHTFLHTPCPAHSPAHPHALCLACSLLMTGLWSFHCYSLMAVSLPWYRWGGILFVFWLKTIQFTSKMNLIILFLHCVTLGGTTTLTVIGMAPLELGNVVISVLGNSIFHKSNSFDIVLFLC